MEVCWRIFGRKGGHALSRRRVADGKPSDHDLTVIIPAYNEACRLPRSLLVLQEFLDQWAIDYRILVVDDGSQDATSHCTEGMGWRVSTLRLSRQCGKGSAVRAGMLSATGRVVAFTDADLPYDLTALRQGYEKIRSRRCQIVYGARDAEGATCLVKRRALRTAASLVFRWLMRCLVSDQVTDTQCGLKLFTRQAATTVFSRALINGFAFDAELVMLATRLGLAFERIPVTLVNEYASTLSLTRHALPMLIDVFRVRAGCLSGAYDLPVREAVSMSTPALANQRQALPA